MKLIKQVLDEIHRRSLWQVLGLYLAGGWVVLQVVSTLREEQILPDWAFRVAFALLVAGLPIVLLTAFVQNVHKGPRSDAAPRGIGALLTWRNAVVGGLAAFSVSEPPKLSARRRMPRPLLRRPSTHPVGASPNQRRFQPNALPRAPLGLRLPPSKTSDLAELPHLMPRQPLWMPYPSVGS